MRKTILLIALITVVCIEAYSQIHFEDGYFIDESNSRIECLIKNMDWRKNPPEFEYKFSPDEAVQKATIQSVKEFGINDASKYIRATTNIDRSSDQIDNMSSDRSPSFNEELLFLKVLVEGQASLFVYIDENLTRFFYQLNDPEINQLVYKRYLAEHNKLAKNKLLVNNDFKQQLFLRLKCDDIGPTDLEHLTYAKRDLERLFIKYNKCAGAGYIHYNPKQKKDLFNMAFRPGLNYSSLDVHNIYTGSRYTYLGHFGIRFGVEAEFIAPFHKNKWGLIIEPTYQSFKSEQTQESPFISGGVVLAKVNYQSMELPLGLRHYFFLNENSKIFMNVSYVFDFAPNSSIKFLREDGSIFNELEIQSEPNIGFGIGYKYKDRYGLEIRYHTIREILNGYYIWVSEYKTLSVTLQYSIF